MNTISVLSPFLFLYLLRVSGQWWFLVGLCPALQRQRQHRAWKVKGYSLYIHRGMQCSSPSASPHHLASPVLQKAPLHISSVHHLKSRSIKESSCCSSYKLRESPRRLNVLWASEHELTLGGVHVCRLASPWRKKKTWLFYPMFVWVLLVL